LCCGEAKRVGGSARGEKAEVGAAAGKKKQRKELIIQGSNNMKKKKKKKKRKKRPVGSLKGQGGGESSRKTAPGLSRARKKVPHVKPKEQRRLIRRNEDVAQFIERQIWKKKEKPKKACAST